MKFINLKHLISEKLTQAKFPDEKWKRANYSFRKRQIRRRCWNTHRGKDINRAKEHKEWNKPAKETHIVKQTDRQKRTT